MARDISEALAQIIQERSISEEAALKIVEETILAAYKRRFGQDDNALVRFSEDNKSVSIYAQKQVVDGVFDPVMEIELEEAKMQAPDAEEGDSLLIELDPLDFGRHAVQSARQTAMQNIREIRKDSLYAEFKDKEGEIIIGYFQRERNGAIYVDLGKIEGVLPKKFQSPREKYEVNDRIKALITKVEKTPTGLQVVLSRTHTEFVLAIFELEVPEIYDKTVEVFKIVREPGYRTKLAVFTGKDDIDPVGACVGMKGARIQNVIRELEGEKIDVLKYDEDPQVFVANALSPAEVRNIIILDEKKREALAVVNESQLSLAIGKQGLNVRLANRLTDWSIDVKTIEQYEESEYYTGAKHVASELFGDDGDEDLVIADLEGVDTEVVKILADNGIAGVQDYYDTAEDDILALGITREQLDALNAVLEEYVEFEEEADASVDTDMSVDTDVPADTDMSVDTDEPDEDDGESDEVDADAEVGEPADAQDNDGEPEDGDAYECPHCGASISEEMTKCPSCGAEIEWE